MRYWCPFHVSTWLPGEPQRVGPAHFTLNAFKHATICNSEVLVFPFTKPIDPQIRAMTVPYRASSCSYPWNFGSPSADKLGLLWHPGASERRSPLSPVLQRKKQDSEHLTTVLGEVRLDPLSLLRDSLPLYSSTNQFHVIPYFGKTTELCCINPRSFAVRRPRLSST